jgi:hypothetical protein
MLERGLVFEGYNEGRQQGKVRAPLPQPFGAQGRLPFLSVHGRLLRHGRARRR